jgi:hypothetical protein
MTEHPGVRVPAVLDGVPTEVFVTGRFVAEKRPEARPEKPGNQKPPKPPEPTDRFARPVPIGVSAGPDWSGGGYIFAGTIGAKVTDSAGQVLSLSNNHVYADGNAVPPGTAILQPGLLDGGDAATDAIGWLHDFEPIRFDGSANTIDAAVALSDDTLIGNATPADGYGAPGSTTTAAELGLGVAKYGRTTGLTSGEVTGVNAMVWVAYQAGTALFTDQIVVRGSRGSFSKPGDSGALVVTGDGANSPVGLLFAGSKRTTLVNPIDPVLARFGVTIDDTPAP